MCVCQCMYNHVLVVKYLPVCVFEYEAPAALLQEAPVSGRLLGAGSVDMRV